MVKQGNLLSKTLVIGIIILLIGMNVVSSTDNISKDNPVDCHILDSIFSSEEILSHEKIAYGYIADNGSSGHPEGPCYFYLDDPGNITSLKPTSSNNSLAGGTWTSDGRWLGCEYDSGCLWEINPETGDMLSIGSGGTSCNGLAWDPNYDRLYATDGSNLIEYNIETGEQELIGSHGQSGKTMVGLVINLDGVCYAWDVRFSGNAKLYTIDLETGEATEVADMGINLIYAGDGDIDYDTDILYITGNGQLFKFDEGNGTIVRDFEGGALITCFAIPYNCSNHPPDPAHDPVPPDGACNVPVDAILCWNGSDPDGDSLKYDVYFGIIYQPIIVEHNQTETCYDPYGPADMLLFEEYYWRIVTWDSEGEFTSSPVWSFTTGINHTQYEIEIDGPTRGKPGITYCYNLSINDYDGTYIILLIDWDDGTNQTEWYESGQNITVCYCWDEKGTYIIRAKAEDQYGEIFAEGELKVTIPRIRISANSLFLHLIDRFPLLEVFLRAMNLLR